MATIDLTPLYRSTIGFDRMASNGDGTTNEATGSERIGILERMRKYFVEDEEIQ